MTLPQFTLGRLLRAVTLLSLACAIVGLCLKWLPRPDIFGDSGATLMILVLCAPAIGGLGGLAVGSLWDRRLKGLVVGIILGLIPAYATIAYIIITSILMYD